jgi:hypothetical protein
MRGIAQRGRGSFIRGRGSGASSSRGLYGRVYGVSGCTGCLAGSSAGRLVGHPDGRLAGSSVGGSTGCLCLYSGCLGFLGMLFRAVGSAARGLDTGLVVDSKCGSLSVIQRLFHILLRFDNVGRAASICGSYDGSLGVFNGSLGISPGAPGIHDRCGTFGCVGGFFS